MSAPSPPPVLLPDPVLLVQNAGKVVDIDIHETLPWLVLAYDTGIVALYDLECGRSIHRFYTASADSFVDASGGPQGVSKSRHGGSTKAGLIRCVRFSKQPRAAENILACLEQDSSSTSTSANSSTTPTTSHHVSCDIVKPDPHISNAIPSTSATSSTAKRNPALVPGGLSVHFSKSEVSLSLVGVVTESMVLVYDYLSFSCVEVPAAVFDHRPQLCLQFISGSSQMLLGGSDGTIRVLNTLTWDLVGSIVTPHKAGVPRLLSFRCGSMDYLCTSGFDGSVFLWDAARKKVLYEHRGHHDEVVAPSFDSLSATLSWVAGEKSIVQVHITSREEEKIKIKAKVPVMHSAPVHPSCGSRFSTFLCLKDDGRLYGFRGSSSTRSSLPESLAEVWSTSSLPDQYRKLRVSGVYTSSCYPSLVFCNLRSAFVVLKCATLRTACCECISSMNAEPLELALCTSMYICKTSVSLRDGEGADTLLQVPQMDTVGCPPVMRTSACKRFVSFHWPSSLKLLILNTRTFGLIKKGYAHDVCWHSTKPSYAILGLCVSSVGEIMAGKGKAGAAAKKKLFRKSKVIPTKSIVSVMQEGGDATSVWTVTKFNIEDNGEVTASDAHVLALAHAPEREFTVTGSLFDGPLIGVSTAFPSIVSNEGESGDKSTSEQEKEGGGAGGAGGAGASAIPSAGGNSGSNHNGQAASSGGERSSFSKQPTMAGEKIGNDKGAELQQQGEFNRNTIIFLHWDNHYAEVDRVHLDGVPLSVHWEPPPAQSSCVIRKTSGLSVYYLSGDNLPRNSEEKQEEEEKKSTSVERQSIKEVKGKEEPEWKSPLFQAASFNLSLLAVDILWFNSSLFYSATSEIGILFPRVGPLGRIVLAHSDTSTHNCTFPEDSHARWNPWQVGLGSGHQIDSECNSLLWLSKTQPSGLLKLLGVADDHLLVVNPVFQVLTISLSHPVVKAYLLASAGYVQRAVEWVHTSEFPKSCVGDFSLFLSALGSAAQALQIAQRYASVFALQLELSAGKGRAGDVYRIVQTVQKLCESIYDSTIALYRKGSIADTFAWRTVACLCRALLSALPQGPSLPPGVGKIACEALLIFGSVFEAEFVQTLLLYYIGQNDLEGAREVIRVLRSRLPSSSGEGQDEQRKEHSDRSKERRKSIGRRAGPPIPPRKGLQGIHDGLNLTFEEAYEKMLPVWLVVADWRAIATVKDICELVSSLASC